MEVVMRLARCAWVAAMWVSAGCGGGGSTSGGETSGGGADGTTGGGASGSTTVASTTQGPSAVSSVSASSGGSTYVCDPAAPAGSLFEREAESLSIDILEPVSMCSYRGDVLLIVNTAAI